MGKNQTFILPNYISGSTNSWLDKVLCRNNLANKSEGSIFLNYYFVAPNEATNHEGLLKQLGRRLMGNVTKEESA